MSKAFIEFLRTKEQQELESMMDDVLATKVKWLYFAI
jgi:formate dehydrogenase maturation protein FdhE